MKILNIYLTMAIWLLSLTAIAQDSYENNKIQADSAWSKLNKEYDSRAYDFVSLQTALLKFRENGYKFWRMFPDDSRKYEWLYKTVVDGRAILYWEINDSDTSYKSYLYKGDIPRKSYSWLVDRKKLQEWEKVYLQLREELLLYCAKNPQFANAHFGSMPIDYFLLVAEIKTLLSLSLNQAYRKGSKIDLTELERLLNESAAYLKPYKDNPALIKPFFGHLSWGFMDIHEQYGLSIEDMKTFFNSLKMTSSSVLREWAIQKGSLLALKTEPMILKYVSTKGDTIDLEKLRGKVVLLDFWSTGCSSCIARMPAIKAVYDKYKDRGFEVISACLANNNELARIEAIEEKVGANWPLLMIGWGEHTLGQQIWRKYGFLGVPQYILLNKEGKAVILNDKLSNGDFEPDVQHLLAEEYKSN